MTKKLLLAAVAVLLLIPAALAVWLATLDLDVYREAVAREIAARTGRAVKLDGEVGMAWGLAPTLVLSHLSVANAGWSADPRMLEVERLETTVAILPLLSGELDIRRIRLRGGGLLLETDEEGRSNWAREGGAPSGPPPRFRIGEMDVEDFSLRYRDRVTGVSRSYHVERLEARRGGGSRPIRIEGAMRVNDERLTVAGAMTDLVAYPFSFEVAVEGDGLVVEKSGTVSDLARVEGLDLEVSVAAENGATLARVLDAPVAALAPLTAHMKVTGDAKHMALGDVRLARGGLEATGELVLDLAGPRPAVTGTLASPAMDLRPLLEKEREGVEATRAPGARVFSAETFPVPALPGFDVALTLSVARLELPRLTVENLAATLRAGERTVTLDPVNAVVAGGEAAGRLELTPVGDGVEVRAALDAPGLDLAAILAWAGLAPSFRGTGDLRLDLAGRGDSPAGVAGSLDGEVVVELRGAEARLRGLDALAAGVAGVFSGGGPDPDGWTRLACGALGVDLERGVGRTRLLLDAERAVIYGSGTVNLGDETLDLVVKPEPRSVTLNVAVPVRVAGTLANPTVGPDEASALRRLGALAGAALFPPAALLAFTDRGGGVDPCLERAAATRAESSRESLGDRAGKLADDAGDAAKRVGKGAGKVIEGIGRGLEKGLDGLLGR